MFVEHCLNNGINKIAEMRKEAQKILPQLEREIAELENQKKIKFDFFKEATAFLKRSENDKKIVTVLSNSAWNDLTPQIRELCLDFILQFEKKSKHNATDLTSSILDQDKRKAAITSIKWLMDQKIIFRLGPTVTVGAKWDERKQICKEKNND